MPGYTPRPSPYAPRPTATQATPVASNGYTPRPVPVTSPRDGNDYYREYTRFDYEDEEDTDFGEDDWEDDIDTEEIRLTDELVDQIREIREQGFAVSVDTTLENGYTPYFQVRVPGL